MTTKRVLISIDPRLLDRIDRARERLGLTRSAYLAQLAAADIEGGAAPGADPAVRAALASIDQLFAEASKR